MAAPMGMSGTPNPQMEAVKRVQGPQGAGMPQAQGGNPKSEHGSPMEVAIKLLDAVVAEITKIDPKIAEELGAAVANVKAVIDKVKQELSQGNEGANPPMPGQPPVAQGQGSMPPMPVK